MSLNVPGTGRGKTSSRNCFPATLIMLLCAATVASAHDPMRSWATARASGEGIIVEVEMAGEAAMTLVGVPAGTQPIPEDAAALYGPMEAAVREGRLYRLLANGVAIAPENVSVEHDGDDAFKFRLRFPRPEGGSLQLEAAFLEGLPDEHRTILMLLQPDGAPQGAGRPTKRARTVKMEWPSPGLPD